MMREKILILLLLTIPCIVKAQNNENYFPFQSFSHKANYTLRSIAIDRNNFLPEYYTHAVKYEHNGEVYIVCYSQKRTTLDFINLNTLRYAGGIDLNNLKGFDLSQPILSYNIQGNNLVVFQGEELGVILLNGIKGDLVKSAVINNDKGIFKTNTFHAELGFKPVMSDDGSIFLMNLRYDVTLVDPEYYKGNNEVKVTINGNDLDIEFVPVSYPDSYFKGYYGYYYVPRRTIGGQGRHVFSYTASPVINSWDPLTNHISSKTIKSNYQPDDIAFLDPDAVYTTKELMKYTVETAVYTTLLYDPYRNIYYRFFRPAIAEGVDCVNCNYHHKPLSIMILDENLNLIDELYIGTTIYEEQTSFVGEKGLYLSCANTKNPNFGNGFISYDILTVSNSQNPEEIVSPDLKLSNIDNHTFNITGAWDEESNAVMTIFDLTGKVIYRDIYYSGKVITLSDVPGGIYMIQVSDSKCRTVLKWSKK